ncbi:PREDICTED: visual pigment-like receptor peropsin [Branchiostoma belcheri]|uniref:Visual pigment-like receptor peropsin n=2 Tax=Branchiostoma belcheri TaxID=7741 RepID=A0A6P4XSV0_BRABE|nr:PREDICTED: visual pigment-like receptor peropsin [Branchiostoma belcheri]
MRHSCRNPSQRFYLEMDNSTCCWSTSGGPPWTPGPAGGLRRDDHDWAPNRSNDEPLWAATDFDRYNTTMYQLDPDVHMAIAIYLTIVGIVAVVGNGLAISVFLKEKQFRGKEHNILLLNLAVSDLAIAVFGYSFTVIASYARQWLFGHVWCVLDGFICFTCAMSSMNTLCVISVYRYIIICKPQYACRLTQSFTVHVIVGIWVYALVWTVPPLFGWSSYSMLPFGTSCAIDWYVSSVSDALYVSLCLLGCYVLHITVMAFCYIRVIRRMDSMRFAALASEEARQVVKKDKRKNIIMCLSMVVAFLAVWTPYAVSSTWAIFQRHLPIMALFIPTMCAKSSCMLNPIIYTAFNQRFRKAALRVVKGAAAHARIVPVGWGHRSDAAVSRANTSRENRFQAYLPEDISMATIGYRDNLV